MSALMSLFARRRAGAIGHRVGRIVVAAGLVFGLVVTAPKSARAACVWQEECSEGGRIVATAAQHKGQLYGKRGDGKLIGGSQDFRVPIDCRALVGIVWSETHHGFDGWSSVPTIQRWFRAHWTDPDVHAFFDDLSEPAFLDGEISAADMAALREKIQGSAYPMRAGDLIVFGQIDTARNLDNGTHVGIYDGNGKVWNAESSLLSAPGDGSRPGVQLDPWDGFTWIDKVTKKRVGIVPTMLIRTGFSNMLPLEGALPPAPSGSGPFASPDDFNGDKRGDVLAIKDGVMSLYPSTTFNVGSPVPMQSGPSLAQMASIFSPGDWDGDSYPDLLAVIGSDLLLYRGGPAGFGPPEELGTAADGTNLVDWSQFDGVFSPGHYAGGPAQPAILARRNDGELFLFESGAFDAGRQIGQVGRDANADPTPDPTDTDWSLSFMRWVFSPGDWNLDGKADVIAVDDDGLMWLYPGQQGPGGAYDLGKGVKIGGGWASMDYVFSPGDFDGDAHHYPDLLARRASDGGLFLYKGTGLISFPGAVTAPTQIGWNWNIMTSIFSPGDFLGAGIAANGTTDVLAVNHYGGLVFYQGTKTGFVAGKSVPVGPMDWNGNGTKAFFSVGDVQGDEVSFRDGHPELVTIRQDGTLQLYAGVGVTLSEQPRQIGQVGNGADPSNTNWASMKWVFSPGDFDKDTFGLADIIAVDLTGRMWLYRGRLGADLAYDLEPGVQIGAGWGDKKWVFSGGDYTGDGYPDIAAVNGGDPSAAGYGQFKIYVNNRNGGIGDNMVTGTGWTSEAPFFFNYVFSPGDLGADGLADVLARDSSGRMWLYVPSPGAQLKWSSQHLEVGAGTNWNLMTLSS